MYVLMFDDNTIIKIPGGYKGLQIGLAQWNGKDIPKYMYLWFKEKHVLRDNFKEIENGLLHKKLVSILSYTPDGTRITNAIPAPDFIELHYEEGDLVSTYGDPIYSDEV